MTYVIEIVSRSGELISRRSDFLTQDAALSYLRGWLAPAPAKPGTVAVISDRGGTRLSRFALLGHTARLIT